MKTCSRCRTEKELTEFAVYKGKPHCRCRTCQRESNRAYKNKYPDRIFEQSREYRAKNKLKLREIQRIWRKNTPEKQKQYNRRGYQQRKAQHVEWNRATSLRRNYGMTIPQYDAMYRDQNGVCAICQGFNVAGRRLAVDHNHATGVVRGLLCNTCNTSLGTAKESVDLLKKMIAYLERHEIMASIS